MNKNITGCRFVIFHEFWVKNMGLVLFQMRWLHHSIYTYSHNKQNIPEKEDVNCDDFKVVRIEI